jgi:hypothetical protein
VDFVYWQTLQEFIGGNPIMRNLIYDSPNGRCDCEFSLSLLPSGYMVPCCALAAYAPFNEVTWLPHIDNTTPREAWDYLNGLYNTENSSFRDICKNCDFWLLSYRDESGNSPCVLTIKLENTAPVVLYKKEGEKLKEDLQYIVDYCKPHACTPFFSCPSAEEGQTLSLTARFEKSGNSFAVMVQDAFYNQLVRTKTAKVGDDGVVHLNFRIYASPEELRLVFYPANGTAIEDFLPVSLEITSDAAPGEFSRYVKLKAELENLKNAGLAARTTSSNTFLHKCKRFFKRLLHG